MSDEYSGTMVGDKYRILRLIGKGGMGDVYEAVYEPTGQHVAIKFMAASLTNDPVALGRFRREASLMVELRSKHTARAFGTGVSETHDGRCWIIYELLHGESLAARLERERVIGFDDAARVMFDVLDGLHAAHTHRVLIIHRDITPANLFIDADGVRVLDFGVAKPIRQGVLATTGLTDINLILGTPVYMSPEQFLNPREVDVRTDLHSAGLVFYKMVVASLPYEGLPLGTIIEMKLMGALGSLTKATNLTWPDRVETWFRKMVASNPDDRFESAQVAREALKAACDAMASFKQEPLDRRSSDGADTDVSIGPVRGVGAGPAASRSALQPRKPPSVLYYGTVAERIEGIRRIGLVGEGRSHVHLSADLSVAQIMAGGQVGDPVVIEVRAGDLFAAGGAFYFSESGVWLTERVPAEYCELGVSAHGT